MSLSHHLMGGFILFFSTEFMSSNVYTFTLLNTNTNTHTRVNQSNMITMNSRTFKTILICIILWQKTASSISIGLSAKTIFCIANHHIHNPPDESLPLKSGESQFQIVSQKEGGDQKKKNRKTFVYKHDLQGTHHFHPSSQKRHKHPMFFAHELKSILQKTFLPSLSSNNSNDLNTSPLYPKGYISYSIYNAIQDLSTQLRSVVATQRILEGVGVGKEGATAVSASLNFILRDGAGMLASLFFTARNGSSFGKNIKQWKLFADLIVDVGIFLEVLTLCLPPIFFLPVLCKFMRIIQFFDNITQMLMAVNYEMILSSCPSIQA